MTRLLTIGDSFTYGLELTDPGNKSWSALLAKKLNAEFINLSSGGASNQTMFRCCIEEILNSSEPFDLVVVGWTDPARFEISKSGVPFSVNYSPTMLKLFPWLEQFYKYNQSDELSYRQTLTMMIALQEFLKSKNQQYVFVSTFGLQDLNQQYKQKHRHLIAQIDKDNYLGWPSAGMVEWMGDCKKGAGGHPLDDGHQRIFEKIYEHVSSSR